MKWYTSANSDSLNNLHVDTKPHNLYVCMRFLYAKLWFYLLCFSYWWIWYRFWLFYCKSSIIHCYTFTIVKMVSPNLHTLRPDMYMIRPIQQRLNKVAVDRMCAWWFYDQTSPYASLMFKCHCTLNCFFIVSLSVNVVINTVYVCSKSNVYFSSYFQLIIVFDRSKECKYTLGLCLPLIVHSESCHLCISTVQEVLAQHENKSQKRGGHSHLGCTKHAQLELFHHKAS